MKIDLVGIARRAGKYRRPRFVGRAIEPTRAQELDILRIYMRVVRQWLSAWSADIRPAYERSLFALVRDSVDDTQSEIDAATLALNRLVVTLDAELEDWAVRVEQWHRKQFGTLFTPVGVNLESLLGAGEARSTLKSVLAENTALIRSLNDQLRGGISGAVFRGLTNRTPARDVAREIRKVAALGKTRAELIAADQLQKLTSRLDQERQEQVGLSKFGWLHSGKKHPRPAHIARNGMVFEWKSEVGKDDPPGRAIRCGCKARPVLDFEENVGAIEQAVEAPVPAPTPAAKGPRTGFTSPINPSVNAETIAVSSRLALQKELRARFGKAAADTRYGPREFRDRVEPDLGNASLAAALDDEAASMVAALLPELDSLALQLGIPPLRGIKSLSGNRAVANQGDGVLGINPTYFNGYASRVGGRSPTGALDEIAAKRAAVQEEMRPLIEELRSVREERNALPMGSPEYQALYAREAALYKRLAPLRNRDEALWKRENVLKRAADGGVKGYSEWKPGDGAKSRPYSTGAYFPEGVDQARTTLFHEFGHHVHQYFKKEGPRRQFGKPPLERDLVRFYRRDLHADPNRILSKYATTDEHEWFAENFAAYVMGRKDLVGPAALELIEGLFNGAY